MSSTTTTTPRKPGVPPPVTKPNPRGEMLWESSPSRYISKWSATSRKEILRPIDPDELLVHAHRDNNPVEVTAQVIASRLINITGNEDAVRDGMRRATLFGVRIAEGLGDALGSKAVEKRAKRLIGVGNRDVFFQFREPTHLSEKEVRAHVERLQADARAALKARGRSPRLQVLLTGATGFLGKEILRQAVHDKRIAQMVCVVRPETVRDPKTRQVVKVLTPARRGAILLKRLGIAGAGAKKFRFVGGDIERPDLGVAPREKARLARTLTHVIHCAASVSFDDTYENSYRANVLGARNALGFALSVQRAAGSKFVQHIAIETSYIHGRKKRSIAQESDLVFPKNFYNNFYELTKAMASLDTDRYMVLEGLRVSQLLPSIVIGHSRTGNNFGDTKVVNAPINAFGRAKEGLEKLGGGWWGRSKAKMLSRVALAFPGDPTAELNIVPVDRVVQGILAALTVPESIGERVHLATDNRIRSEDIVRITREEIGIDVHLADPTLFRNVTLPLLKAALERLNEPKLANALEKLSTIFGGYGEWGQPIHDVGNDVRVLGLTIKRPNTENAFRMLCRHNRFVQEFGRVRDPDEVARRERLWSEVLEEIEFETGRQAVAFPPDSFQELLAKKMDLKSFQRRK